MPICDNGGGGRILSAGYGGWECFGNWCSVCVSEGVGRGVSITNNVCHVKNRRVRMGLVTFSTQLKLYVPLFMFLPASSRSVYAATGVQS